VTEHPYCPKRGDVVWLSFVPQAGHEQAGRRPVLTLSPEAYNRKTSLAVFCPITTQAKGYPFEIPVPKGLKASGVVLSDHVKSLDWVARKAEFYCRVPEATVVEVLERLGVLLSAGETVVIAKNGRPVAKIVPFRQSSRTQRRFGTARKTVRLSPGWDAPQLSPKAREILGDADNALFFSAASAPSSGPWGL